MNKVRRADAQWQIAPTSCAHHCFRKVNMASLRKQLVHNEPLLCVVPGCGRWQSRYNMPAHLEVDDTHKDFVSTAEQKAKWEVGEEEKAVLQLGLTASQKLLSKEKSAKEKKRVQEKRHKLKGEVALQREILAKAAARKEKKASRRKQKKAARRAAREGDQEAEAVMEVQDSGTQTINHTAAAIAKAKATATAVVAATAATTVVRAAAAAAVALAAAATVAKKQRKRKA